MIFLQEAFPTCCLAGGGVTEFVVLHSHEEFPMPFSSRFTFHWLAMAGVLLSFGGMGDVVAEDAQSRLRTAYLELLARFPEESQGKGLDPEGHVGDQPMTYGLVLWAEALRYRAAPTAAGARRVKAATRWLVDHSDLDRDGKPGWGLPQAWISGSDGKHNPAHNVYTITTGICLLGLLEAATLPEFWKPGESEELRGLMHAVHLRWCREMWLPGYTGGYFRYSPTPKDNIFCVNAPGMYLGALTWHLRLYGAHLPAEERALLENRRDVFVRTVIATMIPRGGLAYWNYIAPTDQNQSSKPNDLLHHIYTLWGLEMYRDLGGPVALPWTRAQARESVEKFWKGDRMCQYAVDEMRIAKTGNREYPSIVWGTGSLLAFYGKWGSAVQAAHCQEVIVRSYGPWPDLRLYPPTFGPPAHKDDTRFYPRHAAHNLLGLAYAAYAQAVP